ncbi:hypothetical protein ABZ532_16275 [Streptomyces sp. NPDC019396]|uniref:hypothetical protein n=1 Tax=Streptomyces sp. NPDC019396 TaxID=3154687 RepID=UPI0033C438D3
MDQLGDKPEQIRKHLEEEKQRHAREAGASPGGGDGASREAPGEDAYDDLSDESLGDLGDVIRNESYRGGPEQG